MKPFKSTYNSSCTCWYILIFHENKNYCVHFLFNYNKSFRNNHILCLIYVLFICISILLKKTLITTYAKKMLILRMWYTCSHWWLSNDTTIVTLPFQNNLGKYFFIFSLQPYNPNFFKSLDILKKVLKKIPHIIANRYLCSYIGAYN